MNYPSLLFLPDFQITTPQHFRSAHRTTQQLNIMMHTTTQLAGTYSQSLRVLEPAQPLDLRTIRALQRAHLEPDMVLRRNTITSSKRVRPNYSIDRRTQLADGRTIADAIGSILIDSQKTVTATGAVEQCTRHYSVADLKYDLKNGTLVDPRPPAVVAPRVVTDPLAQVAAPSATVSVTTPSTDVTANATTTATVSSQRQQQELLRRMQQRSRASKERRRLRKEKLDATRRAAKATRVWRSRIQPILAPGEMSAEVVPASVRVPALAPVPTPAPAPVPTPAPETTPVRSAWADFMADV